MTEFNTGDFDPNELELMRDVLAMVSLMVNEHPSALVNAALHTLTPDRKQARDVSVMLLGILYIALRQPFKPTTTARRKWDQLLTKMTLDIDKEEANDRR